MSARAQAFLFWFVAAYFVLNVFPFPLSSIPGSDFLVSLYSEPRGRLVHWLGLRLLALPTQRWNVGGCGDRADEYVSALFDASLAFVAALAGVCAGRAAERQRRLSYWLRGTARYYLAATLLQYGSIKILKSQFPEPGPTRLVQSVGDLGLMEALWLFMGVSTPYCVFVGSCEALGGALLFFRRTSLAGALLSFAVLLNVFLLNVFYGVCVKLYSLHLLVMAGALLVPDAQRLFDVLLSNRAVLARPFAVPALSVRAHRVLLAAKVVFISGSVWLAGWTAWNNWHEFGDAAPLPALYGIWDVRAFERAGAEPGASDPNAWSLLAVERENYGTLRLVNGKTSSVRIDPAAHTLSVGGANGKEPSRSFPFQQPSADSLEVSGEDSSGPAPIHLQRRPRQQIPLLTRRFRWISDLPSGADH